MLKNKVSSIFHKIIKNKSLKLQRPKHSSFGDYALHTSQLDSIHTDTVIKKLSESPLFENVEKKGLFINVFLSKNTLIDEVNNILEKKDLYGSFKSSYPQKILLEFGQPNTHKLPHVGHFFSYIYGESCARMIENSGNTVFRCNYQGDIGLHVAKCLYYLQKNIETVKQVQTPEEKVSLLQDAYQKGSALHSKDPSAKEEIDVLNKKLYEYDASISELWKETREWSLSYYRDFEKKLGIAFNKYYYESDTSPLGIKIVQKNAGKIFEKSDGAIIFRGESFGLHTRVFITTNGTPTYEAKDVGLAYQKLHDFSFEKAIVNTASEQNEYWKVVKKAIELTLPELEGKIQQLGFGMIDLKTGKMSSRKGNIISAMELLEKVKQNVRDVLFSGQSVDEKTLEIVTLGAIKYAFLRSEAKKNIVFDIDESISLHGNSGPYLQYAYARIQSVISKEQLVIDISHDYEPNKEESSLMRILAKFCEIVEEATEYYAPHIICSYLFELAKIYNAFYEKCPILQSSDDEKPFRLALSQATAHIIRNGLHLLGIQVVHKL